MKNANHYFEEIGIWPTHSRILRAYIIGFVGSVIITLVAYLLALHHVFSFRTSIIVLLLLACVQFVVQAIFFLHLGKQSRERVALLACAITVVLILVVGSLWIMFNLSGRMMPNMQQMEQYMNNQDGI